jgi:alpha-tubulin suppressor-like RCC1 family protein
MQLGRDDAPTRGKPGFVPGIEDAVEIGAGSHVSCARLRDGSVWCWGSDLAGGLGDGDVRLERRCSAQGCSATPLRVKGVERATRIEIGELAHCAITTEGERRCWGNNEYGLYAPKEVRTLHEATPLPPEMPAATQWSARSANVCGVRPDGGVWCLGDDTMGTLGDGRSFHAPCWRKEVDCSPKPVTVAGLTDVAEVSLGGDFACARLNDGRVACWGEGEAGQLGDGKETHGRCAFADTELDCSRTPVMVEGLVDAVQIGCGTWHCCARTRAGEVRCWGDNDAGQLGVATTASRCRSATRKPFDCSRTPMIVQGLPNVADLSTGNHATCALTEAGEVWCWGADAGGQLGDEGKAQCRQGKRHVSNACSKVPLRIPF